MCAMDVLLGIRTGLLGGNIEETFEMRELNGGELTGCPEDERRGIILGRCESA
jgi:hypothetical protein